MRRKQNILHLPVCTVTYVSVKFSPMETCIYNYIWDKTKQELSQNELDLLMSEDFLVNLDFNILEKLLRVRQCCDSFTLIKVRRKDHKLKEQMKELQRELDIKENANIDPEIQLKLAKERALDNAFYNLEKPLQSNDDGQGKTIYFSIAGNNNKRKLDDLIQQSSTQKTFENNQKETNFISNTTTIPKNATINNHALTINKQDSEEGEWIMRRKPTVSVIDSSTKSIQSATLTKNLEFEDDGYEKKIGILTNNNNNNTKKIAFIDNKEIDNDVVEDANSKSSMKNAFKINPMFNSVITSLNLDRFVILGILFYMFLKKTHILLFRQQKHKIIEFCLQVLCL